MLFMSGWVLRRRQILLPTTGDKLWRDVHEVVDQCGGKWEDEVMELSL